MNAPTTVDRLLAAPLGAPNAYPGARRYSDLAYLRRAFKRRGFDTRVVGNLLLMASKGGQTCYTMDTESGYTSLVAGRILRQKDLARQLFMRAGLSVAEGRAFPKSATESGLSYLKELGGGVVLKPSDGNKGRGVTVGVTPENYLAAWEAAAAASTRKVLMERQVTGSEARYLVVDGRCIAVCRRIPPHVVGDGQRTVRELVASKNEARKLNPNLGRCPIVVDAHREGIIRSQGYALDAIPAESVHVIIDYKAGISTGADSQDLTPIVHPTMKKVAETVSTVMPGLDIIGVDIMAEDHTAPATSDGYTIIEANTRPMIAMHIYPAHGEPVNVGRHIVRSCERRMRQARIDASAAPRPTRAIAACNDTEAPEDYRVLFTGDICFGESYASGSLAEPLRGLLASEGHGASLRDLQPILDQADLVIGNLEVPLAGADAVGSFEGKRFLAWSTPDQTAEALRTAGFHALSLANNHALDCGHDGLRTTIERLRAEGIEAFGAGGNLAEAQLPFIKTFEVAGVKRSLVVFGAFEFRPRYEGYSWYATAAECGVNPIDAKRISDQVAALRETLPRPLFIAYPHWGTDYKSTRAHQRKYARELISAGIDLVIGHGAHVAQNIERFNDHLLLFGLGNFTFNSPGRFNANEAKPIGLASMLRISASDPDLCWLRSYPILTDNLVTGFRSRPVDGDLFAETTDSLLRRMDAGGEDLRRGRDDFGHYFEIRL